MTRGAVPILLPDNGNSDQKSKKTGPWSPGFATKTTCQFMIPVVKVYYYPTGNKANPQYRIYRVEVDLQQHFWNYNQNDPRVRQEFQLSLLVKFMKLDSKTPFFWKPPSRKLDIKLPSTWLYPFYTNY